MIGEEGAEFVRSPGENEEHVRHEAGLFLHRNDAGSDIVRHFGQRWGRVVSPVVV
jgi:hypothetical protein